MLTLKSLVDRCQLFDIRDVVILLSFVSRPRFHFMFSIVIKKGNFLYTTTLRFLALIFYYLFFHFFFSQKKRGPSAPGEKIFKVPYLIFMSSHRDSTSHFRIFPPLPKLFPGLQKKKCFRLSILLIDPSTTRKKFRRL